MNIIKAEHYLIMLKSVLDYFDIKFWPLGGTFLGFYRDGGLIPWDTDIDLGIYQEDLLRFVDCIVRFMELGLVVKICESKNMVMLGAKGVKIDIHLLPLVGDKRILHFMEYDAADFETVDTAILYLGEAWRILRNPEKWLKYAYGDNWRIPTRDRTGMGTGYPLGE